MSFVTTKKPCDDSSVSNISLVSFSSDLRRTVGGLTVVVAFARRCSVAHRRIQLAVVRLVKFFVQLRSHVDRELAGLLPKLRFSTKVGEVRVVVTRRRCGVRYSLRGNALRRAASNAISGISRSSFAPVATCRGRDVVGRMFVKAEINTSWIKLNHHQLVFYVVVGELHRKRTAQITRTKDAPFPLDVMLQHQNFEDHRNACHRNERKRDRNPSKHISWHRLALKKLALTASA